MARIRSLKPELWHDRKLARLVPNPWARLLYIGLWNQADEHARCNGDPAVIKGQVLPYDDVDVESLLRALGRARRIVLYDVDGDPFLWIPSLDRHQKLEPDRVASKYPPPPAETVAEFSGADPVADPSERTSNPRARGRAGDSGSMEHGPGVARACPREPGPDPASARVVEAFMSVAIRETTNGKRPKPTQRVRAGVANSAANLLRQGIPVEQLIASATRLGESGYTDLAQQVRMDTARYNGKTHGPDPPPRHPTMDELRAKGEIPP